VRLGTERRFARDEILFRIGEPGTEAFLIVRGCVKIFADSVDGRLVLLSIRMPGELVGELAPLDGQLRSATGRAAGPVTARAIGAKVLNGYLAAHPAANRAVRDRIAARLREAAQERIQVINAAPVPRRLAWALCLLSERYGVPVPDGVLVDVPLSQADIASLLATTEQSVRKALAGLRAEGVVRWTYRKTVITDPGKLRDIAYSATGNRERPA
jgi:CRP/FNR family cyclic AMP-dependent transcriptional regulator